MVGIVPRVVSFPRIPKASSRADRELGELSHHASDHYPHLPPPPTHPSPSSYIRTTHPPILPCSHYNNHLSSRTPLLSHDTP